MSSTLLETDHALSPIAADPTWMVDAAGQQPVPSPDIEGALPSPVQLKPTDDTESDMCAADARSEQPAPFPEDATEEVSSDLAAELERLVRSVSTVEELSRQARDAATGDLARFQALAASAAQYRDGLARARQLQQEAHVAVEHAFGHAARAAARSILNDAERIHAAFVELVQAWDTRAQDFLGAHPDVELLVAEQAAREEQTRRQQQLEARARQRQAILAALDGALEAGMLSETPRLLERLERECPEEPDLLQTAQRRVRSAVREQKDLAARQALEIAGAQRAQGDYEAALATLEQVDVEGLSIELGQDVFGRWCDTCSRLAQATAAHLVRYAPRQGRGLVLLKDHSRPRELVVFSSLGMGPDYPPNARISPLLDDNERRDPAARRRAAAADTILARAREFRAALDAPGAWATYAAPTGPASIAHH